MYCNGFSVDHDRCHTCLTTQKSVVSELITFQKRAGYITRVVVLLVVKKKGDLYGKVSK